MEQYISKEFPDGASVEAALLRAKAGGAIDITLANKAPAGYGLGTTPKLITDWNDAKVGGWFWSQVGAANAPDSTIECFGGVDNHGNPEICVQEVWGLANINKYYHWIRFVYPGTGNGTPWEWVNPPMILGVEYRTTERYQGKPVYVQAVNFGAITDGKTVTAGENVQYFVRGHGMIAQGLGGAIPSINGLGWNDWSVLFDYGISNGAVSITCHAGASMSGAWQNCVSVIYYTKTTD